LVFSGELLSEGLYQEILRFSPPVIPSALVREFLKTTSLSRQESLRIERECMTLWRQEGGSVRNPHPLLEEVITAMSLYEKFGILTWGNLDQIHVKTYLVIRKVLEAYATSQSLNMKEDALRRKVAQQAGLRPGGY
jgi:hypothetical protein